MPTLVNEGVIVRYGIAKNGQEYLVLWSPTSNHSFIFKSDIIDDEWFEAGVCEWREYDIDINYTRGPEGIETQAYNLRKPKDDSNNPCTTPSQAYTDVHSLRTVNVFVPLENTVKFKDTFDVTDGVYDRISGKFVKNARISPSDVRELRKCNITSFEGIAMLLPVVKRDETSPWKITQFVFEAKELSLQGYCCKLGYLRHGRGGALCNRNEAYVPPDPLRLKNVSMPSKFSLNVTVPSAQTNTAAPPAKNTAVTSAPAKTGPAAPSTSSTLPPSTPKTTSMTSVAINTSATSASTGNQDRPFAPKNNTSVPSVPAKTAAVKKPFPTGEFVRKPEIIKAIVTRLPDAEGDDKSNRLIVSHSNPSPATPVLSLEDDNPGFPAIVNGKTNSSFFVHIFHKDISAMLRDHFLVKDIQVGDIIAVKIRPDQNSRHEVTDAKKIIPPKSIISTFRDNSGFAAGTDKKYGRIFYNTFAGQIYDNFNRIPNGVKRDREIILEASVKLMRGGRQACLVCTRYLGYGDQAALEASKEYNNVKNKPIVNRNNEVQDMRERRNPSHLQGYLKWSLGVLEETLVQETIDAERLWDDYLVVLRKLHETNQR